MTQVHLLVGPPTLHLYKQVKVEQLKFKHLIQCEQDGPHGLALGALMMVTQGNSCGCSLLLVCFVNHIEFMHVFENDFVNLLREEPTVVSA